MRQKPQFSVRTAVLSIVACALLPTASPAARHSTSPAAPAKQIYELSSSIQQSEILQASGVAAYVISAMGRNRGTLLKDVQTGGLAANLGMSAGDVILNFDNHVISDPRDADRVLGGTPNGTVHFTFVHPGDNGLQLYNSSFPYVNRAPKRTVVELNPDSIDSRMKSDAHRSAAANDQLAFHPECESYAVELINKDRRSNGSGQISSNGNLNTLARSHAEDMLKRNFFNHVNPDGLDPQGRAKAHGIAGGVYENISFENGNPNFSASVAICESRMMAEPPNQQNHRSNIIGPQHTCVGVGIATLGKKLVMVQEFSDGNP